MITLVFHRNLVCSPISCNQLYGLLFQIPILLCTIIHTAIYAYVQPFDNQWVNILETTVLVDILLMLAISSTAKFKVSQLYLYYMNVYLTAKWQSALLAITISKIITKIAKCSNTYVIAH